MDFFQQIDNIALLEPAAHFELFRSISNALNSKEILVFRQLEETT